MGGLFGNNSKTKIPKYTGMVIQTSNQVVPIPICWGLNRGATNIVWYGNFKRKKVGSGKGGSSSQEYNYDANFILGVCEGPVSDIAAVWAGDSASTLEIMGMGVTYGSPQQAPLPFLNGDEALGYGNTCLVYATDYNLGDTPDMPSFNVLIWGFRHGEVPGDRVGQANPANIMMDVLTSPIYGFSQQGSIFEPNGWNQYKTYCEAQLLILSPIQNEQEQLTDTLTRWAQLTNTWIFWSENQLKLVPLGDSPVQGVATLYTPNLTVVYSLTPDDFVQTSHTDDPIIVTRSDPTNGYNICEVDCKDCDNNMEDTVVIWKDQASIDLYGELQTNSVSATEVVDPTVAARMAMLIGKRASNIRNTYKFNLTINYLLLEPGDIVALTMPQLGFNQLQVRIQSVQENTDGYLECEAEEFPEGVGTVNSTPAMEVNAAQPTYNRNIDPGNVNPPLIFEPQTAITGGTPELWIGASGGTNWGGCNVWLSFDNVTYSQIGSISEPIIQGTTTAALPAHADPDTTDTLAVDTSISDGVIPATATQADADAGRTLVLVDSEVLAYGAAASGSTANGFNLTYLRRGLQGSTIAAHAVGAPFFRIDSTSLFDYVLEKQYVGKTVYLKFTSVNIFGNMEQELSDVTAYSYQIQGEAYTVLPPGIPTLAVTRTTQKDGTTLLTMTATWAASADTSLGGYEAQWSTDNTNWTIDHSLGSSATTDSVQPAAANTAYYCRVRSVSENGQAQSAWQVSTVLNSGDLLTSVPAAPTGGSAVVTTAGVYYSWTLQDPTVLYANVYRAAGLNAAFSSASKIAQVTGNNFTDNTVGSNTGYTYFVTFTNAKGSSTNSAGSSVTSATLGTGLPYDIAAGYPGLVPASQVIFIFDAVRPFTLPASLTGSQAVASVAATGQTVFNMLKNGSSIGTVTFAAGSNQGTFSFTSAVSFAPGDTFEVDAPATADTTLTSPTFTFAGTR